MCSAHTVVLHLRGSAVRPFSVVTLSVLYGLLCTLCPVGVIGGGALGGCPLGETCVVYVVVCGFFPVGCVGSSLCCVSLYSNVLLCLPCV